MPAFVGTTRTLLSGNVAAFSPKSFSGLQMWLDASQLAGFADADPVATWTDLSGNGRNLTQATTSKRPTYRLNVQNGKPVVRFDGVDDYLKATAFTLNQPETVCIAFKETAVSILFPIVFDGNTANSMILYRNNSPTWVMNAGSNGPSVTESTGVHAIIAIFNGASSVMKLDSTADTAASTVGATNGGGFTLSARADAVGPANHDVYEVLVYNKALSSTEKATIAAYLKQKWSTP